MEAEKYVSVLQERAQHQQQRQHQLWLSHRIKVKREGKAKKTRIYWRHRNVCVTDLNEPCPRSKSPSCSSSVAKYCIVYEGFAYFAAFDLETFPAR